MLTKLKRNSTKFSRKNISKFQNFGYLLNWSAMELNDIVELSLEFNTCRLIGSQFLRFSFLVQHFQRTIDIRWAINYTKAHWTEKEKGRYDEFQNQVAPKGLLEYDAYEAKRRAPVVEGAVGGETERRRYRGREKANFSWFIKSTKTPIWS